MDFNIDINKLLKIITICLNEIKEINEEIVNIDKNDYYETSEKRYNFDGCDEINVGSLKDDWDFLNLSHDRGDAANPYMLIHAAPILRFLAEKFAKDSGGGA